MDSKSKLKKKRLLVGGLAAVEDVNDDGGTDEGSDAIDRKRCFLQKISLKPICFSQKILYLCHCKLNAISFMPKIFEYFGFIFYFYSNEHEPIHVHVIHGGKESIFDLIMMDGVLSEIRVREKKGAEELSEKEKRTAKDFIQKYHKNIINKWVKFFVLKQAVRSTNIKKKL